MRRYVDLNSDVEDLSDAGGYARHMHSVLVSAASSDTKLSFVTLLYMQKQFSEYAFGPHDQRGVGGNIAHIRKELDEVEGAPLDLLEWYDLILLAMDGASRAAATLGISQPVKHVALGLFAKLAQNMLREWPDYRDVPVGQAIEHVRSEASAARKADELAVDGRPVLPGGDTPLELRRFSMKQKGKFSLIDLGLPNTRSVLREPLIRLKVGEVWCGDGERWERTADAPSTGDAYTAGNPGGNVPIKERRFTYQLHSEDLTPTPDVEMPRHLTPGTDLYVALAHLEVGEHHEDRCNSNVWTRTK